MRRRFVQGRRGRIEVVTDRGIAADQDEIFSLSCPKGLQQPEHAFDRHIHHEIGNLLARGHVNHMRDALHDGFDEGTFGDVAGDDHEPRVGNIKSSRVGHGGDPERGR